MLSDTLPPKGGAYRSDQVAGHSYYNDPVPGGGSRIHGDAPFAVRRDAVNRLIGAGDAAGLSDRDIAHVLAIADVESGFNPNAAAGPSSATGLGQFINATGSSYGLDGSNRWNVGEQARALVSHFLDNKKLANARGLGERGIYALHHDGPGLNHGGMGLSDSLVAPKRERYERYVAKARECNEVCGDGPGTTTIRGEAKWQTCWRYACYLAKHVYKKPDLNFTTLYPDKMAEVEANWDEWDDLVDDASGLVARLYKPVGFDPQATTNLCPPTLAFRGTDFDDMRGLAILVKVVAFGIGITKVFPLDDRLPDPSFERDLVAAGFTPRTFLDDSGRVVLRDSPLGVPIGTTVEVELQIWMEEDGDRTNNFLQGLGEPSKQYQQALQYGESVARTRILSLAEKRLGITGHSLGGGLASAVCAYLDHQVPEIATHCLTFNSSGVHPNTIAPASVGDGNIHAFAVEDEILTTLGAFKGNLPLVGAIFRLGSRTMGTDSLPPPIGNMLVNNGISPGTSVAHVMNVARGDVLPELFPIGQQTLVPMPRPEGFPLVTELDDMLGGSSNVSDFGQKIERWLSEGYRDRAEALPDGWFDAPLIVKMVRLAMDDLTPELEALTKLFAASAEYHGMDHVIATYDYAYMRAGG